MKEIKESPVIEYLNKEISQSRYDEFEAHFTEEIVNTKIITDRQQHSNEELIKIIGDIIDIAYIVGMLSITSNTRVLELYLDHDEYHLEYMVFNPNIPRIILGKLADSSNEFIKDNAIGILAKGSKWTPDFSKSAVEI